ncbi:MAG: hypothetical protein ACJAVK_002078 [Akkermansiaceae bacterium]|jgi:hypothetical protein
MLDTLEKSAEAVRRAQALTGSPACFGRCKNGTRGLIKTTGDRSSDSWDSDDFEEVGERVPDPEDGSYQWVTMEVDPGSLSRFFARLMVSRKNCPMG